MTVPDELLDAVQGAAERAGVSRNRFVRQTLEAALAKGLKGESREAEEEGRVGDVASRSAPSSAPASPRAPETLVDSDPMTPEEKDRAYAERKNRR